MNQKTKDALKQAVAFISAIGLAAGLIFKGDYSNYVEAAIAILTAAVPLYITVRGIWKNHYATGEPAFKEAEKIRKIQQEQAVSEKIISKG